MSSRRREGIAVSLKTGVDRSSINQAGYSRVRSGERQAANTSCLAVQLICVGLFGKYTGICDSLRNLRLLLVLCLSFGFYTLGNDGPDNLSLHYHGGLHPQVKEVFEFTGVDYKQYTKGVITSDRAQNLVEDGGDNIIQHTKVPPEKNIRGNCGRVFQPVLIPNGDLGLCCQDYGLKHVLGNLLEQTWEEYRNSEEFKDLIYNGADLCDYCVRMDDNYSDTKE